MSRSSTSKTLSAKAAAALDKELMSTSAFSIDQLMELAGLSVSQAGGDGLVAARHLCHYGYQPSVFYPKRSKNELYQRTWRPGNGAKEQRLAISTFMILFMLAQISLRDIQPSSSKFAPRTPLPGPLSSSQSNRPNTFFHHFQRLSKQLEDLEVPFIDDFPTALGSTDHVVDAIFGFSFTGEVREPFPAVIKALGATRLPVISVDAPSSWDIESGPPKTGPGSSFNPEVLVSLTAPKPLVKYFKGRHFIGGRFVAPSIAKKYDFDLPEYEGTDQVTEVDTDGHKL
ncbi:hypothetical protein MKZ38_005479 [Zalerion maritima]|uniref:NAD(P)H-hydrate epimerase n=1 Tax=Zalerion maritima TaxID=339359 RepID=A0AAD5WP91_9PEZI|nr:hypothetical protein MKZ38_005479 [Zalerion maritima]